MRVGTREEYEMRLLKVQMYIQRHLDRDLELDELAKVACFSPFHFHRIFGAMVGESLKEYVRRLRLESAAGRLFYTEKNISTIAMETGYENNQSFSRAFKEHFGVPPRNYRKMRKNGEIHGCNPSPDFNIRFSRPEGIAMPVEIEMFPPQPVAFIRHIGPYHECMNAWDKLYAVPELHAGFKPGGVIGIGYDDPAVTAHHRIRYDACLVVDKNCVLPEWVSRQTIAGGKYAVVKYLGPHEGLHDVYLFLYGKWLPDSGYELRPEQPFEMYYNNPKKTPPDELLTWVCIPIK